MAEVNLGWPFLRMEARKALLSEARGDPPLAIALRASNQHRHLLDLQRISEAIANGVADIIARNAIQSSHGDKITVHAIPETSDPYIESDSP